MIRAIIIDDEPIARERIKDLLLNHQSDIQIIGEAGLGRVAIDKINQLQPDLIFLDIHLPDMNGFEILDKIDNSPMIIFTTAYEEHAMKAYERLSIDYLVKPITQDRFDKSILKLDSLQRSVVSNIQNDLTELKSVLAEFKSKPTSISLTIKQGDRFVLVDYSKMAFLKSEDKYVTVSLIDGKRHIVDKSLTELEATLPAEFIRVHRSYIVNKTCVLEMEKYFKGTLILKLKDKLQTSIKTGETYTSDIRKQLGL